MGGVNRRHGGHEWRLVVVEIVAWKIRARVDGEESCGNEDGGGGEHGGGEEVGVV